MVDFNGYFKGISREWHKEYPETYESIKHDKKEVIRQNIILEICNSHFDFYEDLIHVKKGIVPTHTRGIRSRDSSCVGEWP